MATAQSVKKITPVDAAYITGLIDGEGTITLTRKQRNENRQLAISISSTEKDLLEFVLRTAGVGKITTPQALFMLSTTDRHLACWNNYSPT